MIHKRYLSRWKLPDGSFEFCECLILEVSTSKAYTRVLWSCEDGKTQQEWVDSLELAEALVEELAAPQLQGMPNGFNPVPAPTDFRQFMRRGISRGF